jgi:hypothetical protein
MRPSLRHAMIRCNVLGSSGRRVVERSPGHPGRVGLKSGPLGALERLDQQAARLPPFFALVVARDRDVGRPVTYAVGGAVGS